MDGIEQAGPNPDNTPTEPNHDKGTGGPKHSPLPHVPLSSNQLVIMKAKLFSPQFSFQ